MSDETPSAWLDEARENAERIAPWPRHDPIGSGIVGMFVTSLIVLGFCVVAGLAPSDFEIATAVMAVVGFVVPFVHLRAQQNKHIAELTLQYAIADARAKELK